MKTKNTNHLINADHSPLHGDRVCEPVRGGIVGYVRAVRHTATGLEARVYADGALDGYWILARELELVTRAPDAPIPCTFLG